jgi:hypothetical protein
MTSIAPLPSIANVRAPSVLLLPGEKFFVRRIALTPGQDAAGQVELALETFGPFSPAQIFHGFCPSRDGKQALLFAAYRKNFSTEEIAAWATADLVLPDFALWLAIANPPAAGVWLYENKDVLQLIAWDGGELPAGLLFRKTDRATTDITAGELQEEAAKRLGVPADSPRRLGGNIVIERRSKEGLGLKLDKPGQTMAAQLPLAMARCMDVRDKAELATLAQQQQRTQWLWRTFAGIAVALLLCGVAEIGLQVADTILSRQKQAVKDHGAAAQQIEQADMLARRMEQMAGQRLKPLEMLAAINLLRPKSMNFTRVTAKPPAQMEVDAQTGNAADLNDYKSALLKAPGIIKAEVIDPRTRDGTTTFMLQVAFKPDFSMEGDGK